MTINPSRPPSIFKIVCKGLAAFFLLWILLYFMIYTIGFVADENGFNRNLAEQVDCCNRYYYEKEYVELREYLLLYDAYDETFDMYWEIVDGYCDYMQYQQWAATPADRVPESIGMMEEYREKIMGNAQNCSFAQNQKQLDIYAAEISD